VDSLTSNPILSFLFETALFSTITFSKEFWTIFFLSMEKETGSGSNE
jgi:hypothetical protein|tara:strand:+ start:605 stop:745 length:141 start_codon:yes stop_codon:yes gene_type:complete